MFGAKFKLPDETSIFLVLVVVIGALSFLDPTFGTFDNGMVLLLNGAVVGVLALGQTFVLLTGGIDLSTAAVMAFGGVIATLIMSWGLPWQVACAGALGCSLAVGVVNGLLVRYARLPAFIATFGVSGICSSLAQVIPNGVSITAADSSFSWLGQGKIYGLPVAVALFALVAVGAAALLRWTRLGVHIYALGGNPRAARLAGVNTARTTIFVYATSSTLAGLGGIITASRLMVGFPYVGGGNELFYSIAGAVVGGVSLFGGVGSILGVVIGAVLIATLANGLNVLSISSFWQPFVIGVVILLGVGFDTYRRTASGGSPFGRAIAGLRLRRGPDLKSQTTAVGSTAPPLPPEVADKEP